MFERFFSMCLFLVLWFGFVLISFLLICGVVTLKRLCFKKCAIWCLAIYCWSVSSMNLLSYNDREKKKEEGTLSSIESSDPCPMTKCRMSNAKPLHIFSRHCNDQELPTLCLICFLLMCLVKRWMIIALEYLVPFDANQPLHKNWFLVVTFTGSKIVINSFTLIRWIQDGSVSGVTLNIWQPLQLLITSQCRNLVSDIYNITTLISVVHTLYLVNAKQP